MISIGRMLDKAKKNHRLASDYKLALVMGVSQTTLANYREGKTLPTAKIITSICELSNDDSAIVAVEVEALRAKTPEEKKLWLTVASRMQIGVSRVAFLVIVAIFSIAASALPVSASTVSSIAPDSGLYIMLSKAKEAAAFFLRKFVIFCKRVSFFWLAGINFPKSRVYQY